MRQTEWRARTVFPGNLAAFEAKKTVVILLGLIGMGLNELGYPGSLLCSVVF